MPATNQAADAVTTTSPWKTRELRFIVRLGPLLGLLVLALYWPTLRNEYAYDDIDYLNQTAEVLAGKQALWQTLWRPQGEHLVAGMRLVLHISASLFGADALPFRLLVLAAHVAAALALGLIALRLGGTRAGTATSLAYVLPCGFSSMWIWFPSGASVPFGLALLLSGCAVLVYRDRLGDRLALPLAGAALLLALVCESTLAPLVTLPALIDAHSRWRRGKRLPGIFFGFCLLAASFMVVLSSILFSKTFGPHTAIHPIAAIPKALFLILVAPFRYLFPGIPILAGDPGLRTAALGTLLGLAVAAPTGALLFALWRKERHPSLSLVGLSAVGPLGVVGLVGLGRSYNTYWELYDADRYFFTLLIPLSLLVGAATASVADRMRSWPKLDRRLVSLVVLVALGAESVLHRRAAMGRIPYSVYGEHEHRFKQLGHLYQRLSRAAQALPAGAPPLEFPDTHLWFPHVHNGYLSSAFFLYVVGRGKAERLRLGSATVSERDAAILNRELDAWARDEEEQLPYLSIANGHLTNAHVTRLVDFRSGPQTPAVLSGFYQWDGDSRWMSGEGRLRLTLSSTNVALLMAAPVDRLHAAGIGVPAIELLVVDNATGWTTTLGTLHVEQPGPQLYRLETRPFNSRLGNGRNVDLILRASTTWKPRSVLENSSDQRDVSVQVLAVGVGEALR